MARPREQTAPGLVSYYYPDMDELLVDVHQHAVDRFYWSRMQAVEDVEDPRDKLLRLVVQGLRSRRTAVMRRPWAGSSRPAEPRPG